MPGFYNIDCHKIPLISSDFERFTIFSTVLISVQPPASKFCSKCLAAFSCDSYVEIHQRLRHASSHFPSEMASEPVEYIYDDSQVPAEPGNILNDQIHSEEDSPMKSDDKNLTDPDVSAVVAAYCEV